MLIILTLFLGMAEGLQPAFSYLYAAADQNKLRGLLRIAAAVFLAVFAAEKSKGYFSGFFCAGLNILAIPYFQSTQAPGKALLLSSLRGFLLPGIFILTIPFIAGQSYLWICHSIAEVCTLLMCLLLYFRKVRT